jgi:hypothetical protein
MRIYTDPSVFTKENQNKYLLILNKKECQILIESLKMFESIPAKYKPSTLNLQSVIKEIKTALSVEKNGQTIPNGTYQEEKSCDTCEA